LERDERWRIRVVIRKKGVDGYVTINETSGGGRLQLLASKRSISLGLGHVF